MMASSKIVTLTPETPVLLATSSSHGSNVYIKGATAIVLGGSNVSDENGFLSSTDGIELNMGPDDTLYGLYTGGSSASVFVLQLDQ
jgi:hypothetical protein